MHASARPHATASGGAAAAPYAPLRPPSLARGLALTRAQPGRTPLRSLRPATAVAVVVRAQQQRGTGDRRNNPINGRFFTIRLPGGAEVRVPEGALLRVAAPAGVVAAGAALVGPLVLMAAMSAAIVGSLVAGAGALLVLPVAMMAATGGLVIALGFGAAPVFLLLAAAPIAQAALFALFAAGGLALGYGGVTWALRALQSGGGGGTSGSEDGEDGEAAASLAEAEAQARREALERADELRRFDRLLEQRARERSGGGG